MKFTSARLLRWVVPIAGILAIVVGAVAWYMEERLSAPKFNHDAATVDIAEYGIRPGLHDILTDMPKPPGWIATYVTNDSDASRGNIFVDAFPDRWVGKSRRDLIEAYPANGYWTRVSAGNQVKGPDGAIYYVWTFYETNWLPVRILTWAAAALAVIAWFALALGLFGEARRRMSPGPASGWFLLALVTGPLALAVWYISGQPGQTGICPGCGAETRNDAAFCVKCGHGLRPACPECRRPVETDWEYCAACGEPLREDPA